MKRFFIALLILILPGLSHAEPTRLHIGISSGYPPYYFFDKEQNPSGICIEIIGHVAQKLQIEVYYSSFPWKRMIHNGKEGIVDAIMPLFKTKERSSFLIFPASSLIREDNRFFTLKARELSYSGNLDDVADYHIGVIDGYSYGQEFDTNKAIKNKAIAKGEDHLIQLVLNQRVDMGIGNSMVITYMAAQKNLSEKIQFLSPPVVENPLKQQRPYNPSKYLTLQTLSSEKPFIFYILHEYGSKKAGFNK